jgi:transcriptional regulator with XRE-family HTH domain
MSYQIDRRPPPQRQIDETPPATQKFGVHTFGSFLRQERLSRGLSRALLGAKTQIQPARLIGFESNAGVPGLSEISRLADALGIQREVLLREAGLLRT